MTEKLYYSMGEVAEMLDVSQSLLRFWEKRFDIIKPHKNKKGNRLFSPEDVRNLKTIYHLVKERGMTLAGAEKQLRARRGDIERDMEIAERLGAIRALLVEVRNELTGEGIVVDNGESNDELRTDVKTNAIKLAGEESNYERNDLSVKPVETDNVVAEDTIEVEDAVVKEPESTPKFVEQTLF